MNAMNIDRRSHPPGAVFSKFRAADGWGLRRMDWAQPEGARAIGSLIFLNGRGDFIEKYLEPLGHWHGRGWNVTAFDWRGQGGSAGSMEPGQADNFETLVKDGGALLSKWMAKTPGPHVAVAHSMGGHLLLRILAERQPGLAAAVLVAPMLAINSRPLPGWAARLACSALAIIGRQRPAWKSDRASRLTRQAHLTSCELRFADEMWWRERQRSFDIGPPTWGWLSSAFASMARLRPRLLRKIRTPILLVGAEQDRLVSAEAVRRAARLLPNAKLVMFKDSAHEILRERDEVRLLALRQIDDFLEGQAAR